MSDNPHFAEGKGSQAESIGLDTPSKSAVKESIQLLVNYYARNGCILTQEMADRVSPIIARRYSKLKSVKRITDSTDAE